MRNVWVSVITYNNPHILNGCMHSLFTSDLVTSGKYNWKIEVINNHSNFYLKPEFASRVTVHHQTLRPDWDYVGYFTRDCNSALVRGFKSLTKPINDQVIILQDDVIVKPDFMEKLVHRHDSGIDFIMSGIGDALNSFLPAAVKKIGLYDERFHTGFHEGDYILRAIQALGTRCSIGDIAHGRVWNPTDNGAFYASNNGGDEIFPNAAIPTNVIRAESDLVLCPPFTQEQMNNVGKRHGVVNHHYLWKLKWGENTPFYNWDMHFMQNVIPTLKSNIPSFMVYPYFERHVEKMFDGNPIYRCDCGRCLRAGHMGLLNEDGVMD